MISVVIPLYNKEKSIFYTIHSVLQQTYDQFELIIVNDGSTDNSLEVVKKIKDTRIHLINKPNRGVSSARNAGILASRYDYIAFLDGDDLWSDFHLRTIMDLIHTYSDTTIGGYGTRFCKAKKKGEQKYFKSDNHYISEDYFLAQSSAQSLFNSSSFAIKKEIIKEIGLFDETLSYGEDVEFWYRIFRKFKLAMSESITTSYQLAAENRSVHQPTPLKKRFHQFDYKNANRNEKEYLDKLVALLLLDYAHPSSYKTFFYVLKMYAQRLPFIPAYYIKLISKKIRNEYSL